MVDVTGGKRRVGDQELKGLEQRLVQVATVRAPLHAPEIGDIRGAVRRRVFRPLNLPQCVLHCSGGQGGIQPLKRIM